MAFGEADPVLRSPRLEPGASLFLRSEVLRHTEHLAAKRAGVLGGRRPSAGTIWMLGFGFRILEVRSLRSGHRPRPREGKVEPRCDSTSSTPTRHRTLDLHMLAQVFLIALEDAAAETSRDLREESVRGAKAATIARLEWAHERMGKLISELRSGSMDAYVAERVTSMGDEGGQA
jgi:hypothetical protein